MIVARLDGGLGNQMFQYAAGLALALARRVDLKLDCAPLWRSPNRHFALSSFRLRAGFASRAEVLRLRSRRNLRGVVSLLLRKPLRTYIKERSFHFDDSCLRTAPSDAYLDGYWQSERYFERAIEEVRKDFSFRELPRGRTKELLEEIGSCRAPVSVHVRRGDYVTSPSARAVHGTCGLDYYERALAFLDKKVQPDAHFIFSDDPEWARRNIRTRGTPTFIDHNGPSAAAEDLRLMQACGHHVIANSTFSWWGAWLSSRPEKTIVTPRRWFRSGDRREDDLIPPGWIRI